MLRSRSFSSGTPARDFWIQARTFFCMSLATSILSTSGLFWVSWGYQELVFCEPADGEVPLFGAVACDFAEQLVEVDGVEAPVVDAEEVEEPLEDFGLGRELEGGEDFLEAFEGEEVLFVDAGHAAGEVALAGEGVGVQVDVVAVELHALADLAGVFALLRESGLRAP